MRLMQSGEMYLETIFVLSQKSNTVRAIDVSEHMGFSKPSVSRAIGLLKKGGYVVSDGDGFLSLTPEGRQTAEKIYERHTLLTQVLIKLGVSPEVASEDACRIEHDISDESVQALRRFVKTYGETEL